MEPVSTILASENSCYQDHQWIKKKKKRPPMNDLLAVNPLFTCLFSSALMFHNIQHC